MKIENKYRFLKYIIASICCIVINLVYSIFSHGIYSNYMTYMFVIPLILGIISILINRNNNKEGNDLAFCSILTLIMGVFLKGVFEIAGTSSPYQVIYFIIGCLLYLFGLLWSLKHQL